MIVAKKSKVKVTENENAKSSWESKKYNINIINNINK